MQVKCSIHSPPNTSRSSSWAVWKRTKHNANEKARNDVTNHIICQSVVARNLKFLLRPLNNPSWQWTLEYTKQDGNKQEEMYNVQSCKTPRLYDRIKLTYEQQQLWFDLNRLCLVKLVCFSLSLYPVRM